MVDIFKNRYNKLLITAMFSFLFSSLLLGSIVYIHMHNVFWKFILANIFWLIPAVLFLLWVLYLFTDKLLYSTSLKETHIKWSIICSSVSLIIFYFIVREEGGFGLAGMPRRYYDYSDSHSFHVSQVVIINILSIIFLLSFGLLILIQGLYIVNLVKGIRNPKIEKYHRSD